MNIKDIYVKFIASRNKQRNKKDTFLLSFIANFLLIYPIENGSVMQ